jgi:phosphatidate cytidylyltransferase
MVKDNKIKEVKETSKKEKLLNSIKHLAKKMLKKVDNLINKISDKIYSLDPKENTKQRVISAIILIPVALYAILISKDLFLLLAIMAAIIMTSEWVEITKSAKDFRRWRLIGFFYILIPVYAVIKIRYLDLNILLWMFAIIWSTDIFAFFAGRIFKGAKLAPAISPNKTWSGLVGGVLASVAIGFLSSFMFKGDIAFFMFISALLSVLEQVSDLCESKVKRHFGVKDSGNIIPGHGGLLDRLDGMIFVAPTVLLLMTIFADKF